MFLFLSKILPQLFMPFGLSLQALLLAILVFRRKPQLARGLLVVGFLTLWVLATPACSDVLLRSLEQQFPSHTAHDAPMADAIVILGGGTAARDEDHPEVELGSSGSRLLHGFRLYKAGRAPLIALSGGNIVPPNAREIPDTEALQMKDILLAWGVPESALLLEQRSRNTHENAVETLVLLRKRGIRSLLLVTSAFHMPRASAIFRKEAGRAEPPIVIHPSPTGKFVGGKRAYDALTYLPDAGALGGSTLGLREYVGTLVYRSRGWL